MLTRERIDDLRAHRARFFAAKDGHPDAKRWNNPKERPGKTDTTLRGMLDRGGDYCITTDGLLVVDADSKKAIRWVEKQGWPETFTVQTRRGRHYYFAVETPVRNSVGKLARKVDVRSGPGGQVRGPGSADKTILVDAPVAPAPDDLVERCRALSGGSAADAPRVELDEWLAHHSEGTRNSALTRLIGSPIGRGDSPETVRVLAHLWNRLQNPPMESAEVDATVDSISAAEGSSPLRHLPFRLAEVRLYDGGDGEPRYVWVLEDGTEIDMGDSPTRPTRNEAHKRLIPHGYVLPPMNGARWVNIVRATLPLTKRLAVESAADGLRDTVLDWLGSAVVVVAESGNHRERLRDEPAMEPPPVVDEDGVLWLAVRPLVVWLHSRRADSRVTQTGLSKDLTSKLGFTKVGRVRYGDKDRQAAYYASPPGFASEFAERRTQLAEGSPAYSLPDDWPQA